MAGEEKKTTEPEAQETSTPTTEAESSKKTAKAKKPAAKPKAKSAEAKAAKEPASKSKASEAASDLTQGAKAVYAEAIKDPGFLVKKMDGLLDLAKKPLNESFFDQSSLFLTRLGNFGLLISALVTLVLFIVLTFRMGFDSLFLGIAFVLGLLLAQYVALKFLDSGVSLVKASPSKLSSKAFLECFAMLALVGGLAILIYQITDAISSKNLDSLWQGLAFFALSWFMACIALNPSMVNISMKKDTGTGEEAIGVISFFLKSMVRLAPIVFGVGVTIYTVDLVIKLFYSFGTADAVAEMYSGLFETMKLLLTFGAIPLIAYLAFLAGYLAIDLIRALLSLNK